MGQELIEHYILPSQDYSANLTARLLRSRHLSDLDEFVFVPKGKVISDELWYLRVRRGFAEQVLATK